MGWPNQSCLTNAKSSYISVLFLFTLNTRLYTLALLVKIYWCIKVITNRWAWALVPTKLVEPGNALAWGGGIHGNPTSGFTRYHHTWQFSGILTNQYSPGPELMREGGLGKNTAKQQSYCDNTAKNCKQATAYTSCKVSLLEPSGHP